MKNGDVELGPFPGGVNNVAKPDALPEGTLAHAKNVDLDNEGWPARRKGRVNRVAATRMHSLYLPKQSPVIYANTDGDLAAYDTEYQLTTIRSAIGNRYVSYAQGGDSVYWTNGVLIRRIGADLTDHPVTVPNPGPPTVAASSSGGMAAGEYLVALTWSDLTGRESGASVPVAVEVAANGGILLTGLPLSAEDAVTLNVYVSPANTDTVEDEIALYLYRSVPAGTTTVLVGRHRPGRLCSTLWCSPLPAGSIIRNLHGRMGVASGNTLSWSRGMHHGLMHMDNSLRFGERIHMLEPVGELDSGGVYLADHQRVYYLVGDGPDKWGKTIRHVHSAVPGMSVSAPGDAFGLETTAPCACWLSTTGVFMLGLPGGTVQPITQGRLALNVGDRGAMAFREFEGIRQIFTSFLVGGGNAFGVADSAVATVRRNGLTVD